MKIKLIGGETLRDPLSLLLPEIGAVFQALPIFTKPFLQLREKLQATIQSKNKPIWQHHRL